MALVAAHEGFKEIWPEWEALLLQCPCQRIFQTPAWHHLWWKEMANGSRLKLTAIREDGNLIGIAPLMAQGKDLSFLGDTDLWDYHDFVIAPGREHDFFPALLESIKDQPWSELTLTSVPEDSSCLEHLPRISHDLGFQFEQIPEDVSPGVMLPSSWEEYLAGLSKKDRHELRRKLRRLENRGDFSWYAADTTHALQESLSDFFQLMRESRQDKSEFLTAEREGFFQRMMEKLAEQGLLKLFFMDIGGERVASAICFDYGDTRFLYNSGYNPDYYQLSVGLLLKAMCLRQAIEEGMSYFDFLRGDEPYKYDLGGKDVNLYRLVIHR